MQFEWDDEKSQRNIALGRLSFEDAALVFLDPDRVTLRDERADYGESRFNTFGRIEGRLFVVTYTERGDAIRIIHARKANKREEQKYGNKNNES
jgi:uncharacterized DUF497 family protein